MQERPSRSPTPQSRCFEKLPEASVSLWGQEWSPSGLRRPIPRQQGEITPHNQRRKVRIRVSDGRKKM